jgi:uncharacterized RDD family membrane protein YckC
MQSADTPGPGRRVAGQRLGLPTSGAGSVATWGRRIGALFIDWFTASVVVLVIARGTSPWTPGSPAQLWPLVAWAVIVWLSTGLTGASPGQHLLNLRVIRLDRNPVGLWNGLVRTLLIALVVPPLVADDDRRGWHELAVGTVVVNGPRPAR